MCPYHTVGQLWLEWQPTLQTRLGTLRPLGLICPSPCLYKYCFIESQAIPVIGIICGGFGNTAAELRSCDTDHMAWTTEIFIIWHVTEKFADLFFIQVTHQPNYDVWMLFVDLIFFSKLNIQMCLFSVMRSCLTLGLSALSLLHSVSAPYRPSFPDSCQVALATWLWLWWETERQRKKTAGLFSRLLVVFWQSWISLGLQLLPGEPGGIPGPTRDSRP